MKNIWSNRALLASLLWLFSLGTSSKCEAQDLLRLHAKPTYINGINIPWASFGTDVGEHDEWGSLFDSTWFRNAFAEMQKNGINAARLWLHADGRSSPEFDKSGFVTGLDSSLIPELRIILDLAEQSNIVLVLSLWSFDLTVDRRSKAGAFAGNHSDLLLNSLKSRSYLQNALDPLVKELDQHCALLAWEVMNEPEWLMKGQIFLGEEKPEQVPKSSVQDFLAQQIEYIHDHGTKPVGICSNTLSRLRPGKEYPFYGEAMNKYCANGKDCFPDYISFNYYPWMEIQGFSPFRYDASKLKRAVPLLIGEIPSDNMYLERAFDELFTRGYAGFFSWSYNEEATRSNKAQALSAANRFSQAKQQLLKGGSCADTTQEIQRASRIIDLYPNPASETIHLRLLLEKTERWVVELWAVNGTQVLRESAFLSPGLVDWGIDISHLEQGPYYLGLQNPDNYVHKKVLILR